MPKLMRCLFFIPFVFCLVGCGRTMIRYEYQSVHLSPSITDRMQYIEKAIVNGCLDKGWTPKKIEDGKIIASITVRLVHRITLRVEYDDNGFEMIPVSTSLKKVFGGVHGKYNQWVTNLHWQISKRIGQG